MQGALSYHNLLFGDVENHPILTDLIGAIPVGVDTLSDDIDLLGVDGRVAGDAQPGLGDNEKYL